MESRRRWLLSGAPSCETTVILQEGVRRIREGAFIDCYDLTSIVLPSSIETIESSSFLNANSLQYVYYGGTASSWANVTDNSGRGLTSKMYYYSETEPPLNSAGTAYNGRYWRYENGMPVRWVKSTSPSPPIVTIPTRMG